MEKLKFDELQNWLKTGVAMEPAPENIVRDEKAGDFDFIPVAIVEAELDEIFFGLWKTSGFRWQVVSNEIIGSITLEVYHPVLREWISREGCASVPIQCKKDSAVTDASAKYKNALVKDFPHLKADCLKNAAKSLGRRFGRDLNRKYFDLVGDRLEELENYEGMREEAMRLINAAESVEELRDIMRLKDGEYLKNEILKSEILRKRLELVNSMPKVKKIGKGGEGK